MWHLHFVHICITISFGGFEVKRPINVLFKDSQINIYATSKGKLRVGLGQMGIVSVGYGEMGSVTKEF